LSEVEVKVFLACRRLKTWLLASRIFHGVQLIVHVPKRTIHSFVKEIAPRLLEANKTSEKPGILIGDSTKIRGLGSGEMNNVHVFLSDGGQLLHLGVNSEWPPFEAEVLIWLKGGS